MKQKLFRIIAVAVLLLSLVPVVTIGAQGPRASNFTWLVAKQLTVWYGGINFFSGLVINPQVDEVPLTITGHSTQTSSMLTVEQSDGTDKMTVSNEGQVVFSPEPDSDTANYDYWVEISGDMTGVTTKDRNYGLYIEMTRPAGQEVQSGDFDEAGLKIRVDTEAVTTTAGTVLRGADIEAKADNPDGTVTSLYGASLTAKSDTSAGSVGTMVAMSANAMNNAAVDDFLAAADLRIMRQAATEPTEEYVIWVRSDSTTGSGADAAIYVESNYVTSASTDSFDYGLDMSAAAVNTAELRMSNGETIDNVTDGVLAFGGAIAVVEATAIEIADGGQITVTANSSYLPITSAGVITTSTSTAISNGSKVGQILIIINENASDAITIDDGANTKLSGNAVLGADDSLTVLWDGADWIEIAQADVT